MQSEPRSGGQNLDSLLIMPIQRIPRYILLIEVLLSIPPLFLLFPFFYFWKKTYLKYTDPTYGDYEGLQATLTLVKEVAGHVNSAHAELDNTMFTLCMRLGEEFSVFFFCSFFFFFFVKKKFMWVAMPNYRN